MSTMQAGVSSQHNGYVTNKSQIRWKKGKMDKTEDVKKILLNPRREGFETWVNRVSKEICLLFEPKPGESRLEKSRDLV